MPRLHWCEGREWDDGSIALISSFNCPSPRLLEILSDFPILAMGWLSPILWLIVLFKGKQRYHWNCRQYHLRCGRTVFENGDCLRIVNPSRCKGIRSTNYSFCKQSFIVQPWQIKISRKRTSPRGARTWASFRETMILLLEFLTSKEAFSKFLYRSTRFLVLSGCWSQSQLQNVFGFLHEDFPFCHFNFE